MMETTPGKDLFRNPGPGGKEGGTLCISQYRPSAAFSTVKFLCELFVARAHLGVVFFGSHNYLCYILLFGSLSQLTPHRNTLGIPKEIFLSSGSSAKQCMCVLYESVFIYRCTYRYACMCEGQRTTLGVIPCV